MIQTIPIGNSGEIQFKLNSIAEGYKPEDLFVMALRKNNKKRSFLFVSKVLGKHIPLKPSDMEKATRELAKIYAQKENLEEADGLFQVENPTVCIGFAETATAMGQSFFSHFDGNISYLHSTREEPEGIDSILYACEAHSHATDHNFFLEDEQLMIEAKQIVIIDDEITTGKTALNLMNAINEKYPDKKFYMISFLDWRTQEYRDNFLTALAGREVKTVSLLEGELLSVEVKEPQTEDIIGETVTNETPTFSSTILNLPQSRYVSGEKRYLRHTGRFGITPIDMGMFERALQRKDEEIVSLRQGKCTLVLGQGENMYLPMKVAKLLGDEVYFHATTRSPAWPIDCDNYGINSGLGFEALDGSEYREYIYNIEAHEYDELILITEFSCPQKRIANFMNLAAQTGIQHLHHIVLGE